MKKSWLLSLVIATTALGAAVALEPQRVIPGHYPFGSSQFDALVRDSQSATGDSLTSSFEGWLEKAYATHQKAQLEDYATLTNALKARAAEYAKLKDVNARVALERDTGAWLHRMIKVTIPKFSLDRGFEFTNTVRFGERQCLLQGTLIASLLQKMGFEAGIVMIWRNLQGTPSNLGHVATYLSLSDGHALIVDASEPEPFASHQGVFSYNRRLAQYQFLTPKFDTAGNLTDFNEARVSAITALPYSYVRSQFYFYRGERTPGGFVNKPITPDGLARSQAFLQKAISLEPQNLLAQYVLGYVYNRAGKTDLGTAQFKLSYGLYQKFGYVPDGVKQVMNGLKP